MLIFNCRVIDFSGNIKEISLKSQDINSLKNELKLKGLTLLSYKKSSSTNRVRVNKKDILNFTQTLSLLLNSNLSLKDAIEISATTLNGKLLIKLANIILSGLKKGDSLSTILKEETVGFSPLYLGLIQVGEKTGTLKIVLDQLKIYLEREKKFNDKLSGALIYPGFIISMTILFSILFIIIILPKFNDMFSSLGGGMGSLLIERGKILTNIISIFLLVLTLLIISFLYIKKLSLTDYIKAAKYEKIYFKIPLIGNLILENETFNLIFALSVLTNSSLTIERSLDYGKQVLMNSFLKVEVEGIKALIVSGLPLSESFNRTIFPNKISSFVKVGERTGDISSIFKELSDYYLKESDKRVDRFMVIIDPLFTLLIGAILLTLILLFILPVLSKMGELL